MKENRLWVGLCQGQRSKVTHNRKLISGRVNGQRSKVKGQRSKVKGQTYIKKIVNYMGIVGSSSAILEGYGLVLKCYIGGVWLGPQVLP